MVEHGYAMAAASHTATIFEMGFRTLYLRNSPERAKEWVRHEEAKRSYPENVKLAIKDFFTYAGVTKLDPSVVEKAYKVYTEACWAKHGNPILQKQFGILREGDKNLIQLVPYYGHQPVAMSRLAAIHSIRIVRWLVMWFYQWHLPKEAWGAAEPELDAINRELEAVAKLHGLML